MRKHATRALQHGTGVKDFHQSLLLMEGKVPDGQSAGSTHDRRNLSVALESWSQPPYSESSPLWCLRVTDTIKCLEFLKTNAVNAKNMLAAKEGFKKLCIKNRVDIRNNSDNYRASAFRKAAYRTFIFNKYGRLGKA